MMEFFRVNTKIGLILTVIYYGLLLTASIPTIVRVCREENRTFWSISNENIKSLYEIEKDIHPIIQVIVYVLALLESIYLWEIHFIIIIWLLIKEIKKS